MSLTAIEPDSDDMKRPIVARDDLFPLRLTSMETFHLLDERPGDPNHVFARLRLTGVISREAFTEAVRQLAARQPLFGAVVEKKNGQWNWIRSAALPRIVWYQAGESAQTGDYDLQSEIGIRLHVWQVENQCEILIQVHHALMDGAGAIQAVNDLLRIYHNLLNSDAPEAGLKPNDPRLLAGRNRLELFSRRYLRHLYKQPIALFGAWNFIFRKFATLIPENRDRPQAGANQNGTPNIHGEWLSQEVPETLNRTASQKRITLNTLLMAKLFLAVQHWRVTRGAQDVDAWVRVILPMNMRSVADRKLPAANRSTVIIFDRQQHHMDAWEPFLKYLDREVGMIRNWHLQRMFLLFIRCMAVSKKFLKRSAGSEKPRGTVILTNLGMPFRWSARPGNPVPTGNLELTEFDFVGPVRANTPVNFSVQIHDKRMRLSLHFDAGQIGAVQARSLFEEYRRQLCSDPE